MEDHSKLFNEINGFSQRKLKKVETKLTTASGDNVVEKRGAKGLTTAPVKSAAKKLDLQVGLILPGLMIGKFVELCRIFLNFVGNCAIFDADDVDADGGKGMRGDVMKMKMSYPRYPCFLPESGCRYNSFSHLTMSNGAPTSSSEMRMKG